MSSDPRPLALIIGASGAMGRELAIECARHGFDLLLADVTPLDAVVADLRVIGENVEAVETDLGTMRGVDELGSALRGRAVDALLADAVDADIAGTIDLVQLVARDMVAAGVGRILISGSTIACIESYACALRNELQDSGVTVTCLIPGSTDTDPAEAAMLGFEAMIEGEAKVVAGVHRKLPAALARVAPPGMLAGRNR